MVVTNQTMKVLFLLKDRAYNTNQSKSYGLSNSAWQVAEYLMTLGYECELVSVIDANAIDKELFRYKPDVAIIEALWVMPAKLNGLMEIPRYANIQWIVRIHSDIGFLSAETMASKIVNGYIELGKQNLYISTNHEDFNEYYGEALKYDFVCLPNIITIKNETPPHKVNRERMDIACFGALRTMKNQAFQALCAIHAANKMDKHLYFHVTNNADMTAPDAKPNPVLSNLEQIFKHSGHDLVVHDWMPHDEFETLIKEMDLGLQLSFSESFNIVTADFVNMGVPIIVSPAISWMSRIYMSSTTNYDMVTRDIILFYKLRNWEFLRNPARGSLRKYNRNSEQHWKHFMKYLEKE